MSPTSVLVMWQPPVHRSQVNETFTVQYWPSAAKAGQSQALQEVTTDTLAFIRGLQPATTYTVQVATVDGTGRGVGSDMINVTTEPISKRCHVVQTWLLLLILLHVHDRISTHFLLRNTIKELSSTVSSRTTCESEGCSD